MSCSIYKLGTTPDHANCRFVINRSGKTEVFNFTSIYALNPVDAAEELENKFNIVLKTGDSLEVTADRWRRASSKATKYIVDDQGNFVTWSPSKWRKFNSLFETVRFVKPFRG